MQQKNWQLKDRRLPIEKLLETLSHKKAVCKMLNEIDTWLHRWTGGVNFINILQASFLCKDIFRCFYAHLYFANIL